MPFITPTSPPAGVKLGAGQLNQWASNNRWLWSQAAQDWDCFTGVRFTSSSGFWTTNTEHTFWTGYFPYYGAPTLLGKAAAGGAFRIYVTDNTGEKKVYDGTNIAGALSIALATDGVTPLVFTVGQQYKVRMTTQQSGGTGSGSVDYMAIVIPQPWTWTAPAAFIDSYIETPADLANLAQNQKLLAAQLGGVGASAKTTLGTAALNSIFANGGFFARNGPSANQRDLSVLAKFKAGYLATLKCYDAAGALQDTFSLNNDGAEHLNVVALVGTYGANTFGRYTVESDGDGSYVKRVTLGGAIALTNQPPIAHYLDVVKGNSGVEQLFIIGNQNLLEIKAALGGATLTGFQFLTPSLSQFIDTGVVTLTIDAAERIHTGRTLWYNGAGTAAYGTKSIALPHAGAGLSTWLPVDLNVIPNLPFGMSLTLTGVEAAYEVN